MSLKLNLTNLLIAFVNWFSPATKASTEDMTILTFTHDGDGQKRSENKNGVVTTLIWDGTDYLGEL
jgi:hypothetical protein